MITATPAAADKIKQQLTSRGKGLGLRVGVKPSGCNGFRYVLEFADVITSEDNEYEEHGIKIITDKKSLVYLDGTKLDYVKKGLNEGFEFINENEKNRCGCGESFNV